jgi:hypothetical protein
MDTSRYLWVLQIEELGWCVSVGASASLGLRMSLVMTIEYNTKHHIFVPPANFLWASVVLSI